MLDPDAYANGWAATAEQYNSAGQVTLQTDPLGRTTQWSEALDPSGSGTVTITDARANVTQEILADGEPTAITAGYGSSSTTTTTYSYFPNTDPSETVTTASGTPYAETTTYTYNSEDDLISKSAPAPVATGTWTWAYNRLNEVTYAQTPLEAAASAASGTNVATTHLYDASGNILSSSVPLPVPGTDTPSSTDATTVYGYGTGCSTSGANGCYTGDVQSVTDPDGNVTAYTYDVYGDETQVTTAYGTSSAATSYYNYADAIGEVTSSQTPREHAAGVSATYTYDNYGDLVSSGAPAGRGGCHRQGELRLPGPNGLRGPPRPGRRRRVLPGGGERLGSGHDRVHLRRRRRAHPDDLPRRDDHQGQLRRRWRPAHVDRQGQQRHPVQLRPPRPGDPGPGPRRPHHRLLLLPERPQGHPDRPGRQHHQLRLLPRRPAGDRDRARPFQALALSYNYDSDGNRISSTDLGGDLTKYSYDYLDQKISETDPVNETTGKASTFLYDADGLLVSSTNPMGYTTTTKYDALGQPTKVTRPTAPTSSTRTTPTRTRPITPTPGATSLATTTTTWTS